MNKKYLVLLVVLIIIKLNYAEKLKCKYPNFNTKCICPGSCMNQIGNTSYCELKKCYKWNENLEKCEDSGKDRISAIVLQSIPITGVFGSGFGNIGRWDIFSIYMIIIFGGCFATCLCTCFCNYLNGADTKEAATIAGSKCCSILIAIAILVMWIWGIVMIANRNVLDLNGCELSN